MGRSARRPPLARGGTCWLSGTSHLQTTSPRADRRTANGASPPSQNRPGRCRFQSPASAPLRRAGPAGRITCRLPARLAACLPACRLPARTRTAGLAGLLGRARCGDDQCTTAGARIARSGRRREEAAWLPRRLSDQHRRGRLRMKRDAPHLPGVKVAGDIEKVETRRRRQNLAAMLRVARNFYGGAPDAVGRSGGQISNQTTLSKARGMRRADLRDASFRRSFSTNAHARKEPPWAKATLGIQVFPGSQGAAFCASAAAADEGDAAAQSCASGVVLPADRRTERAGGQSTLPPGPACPTCSAFWSKMDPGTATHRQNGSLIRERHK